MKVGDLVRETWGLERVGVVLSPIRRSTPRDNHELGVMYGDVHPVVDVLISGTGEKAVCDIDQLEVLSENR
jgi:hypothetical protein